jgi:hypothetical protein
MGWCSHSTLDFRLADAWFEYWLGLQLPCYVLVVFLTLL